MLNYLLSPSRRTEPAPDTPPDPYRDIRDEQRTCLVRLHAISERFDAGCLVQLVSRLVDAEQRGDMATRDALLRSLRLRRDALLRSRPEWWDVDADECPW
jgi:hypothetical protein